MKLCMAFAVVTVETNVLRSRILTQSYRREAIYRPQVDHHIHHANPFSNIGQFYVHILTQFPDSRA